MQTITLELVKAKAQEYYITGKLIAQSPYPKLKYAQGQRRCALSACFTPETMTALKQRKLRDGAITEGIVSLANPSELKAIEAIQDAHDQWAMRRGNELLFKALIGLV